VGRIASSENRPNGNADPVLIFGGGYDTQQDFPSIDSPSAPPAPPTPPLPSTSPTGDYIGRAVYVVEASTGEPLKVFSDSSSDFLGGHTIKWSIPSDLTVINADLDAQN